jgi:hypothetical protein
MQLERMLNTLFVMLFVAIPTIPDHYRRCLDARRNKKGGSKRLF